MGLEILQEEQVWANLHDFSPNLQILPCIQSKQAPERAFLFPLLGVTFSFGVAGRYSLKYNHFVGPPSSRQERFSPWPSGLRGHAGRRLLRAGAAADERDLI